MNVLFITLEDVKDINDHGISKDLYREFIKNGHYVYIVSPIERRNGEKTRLIINDNYSILKVKIGNIQKTNIIEKGVATVFIESQIKRALKKHLKNAKIDLVVYATPPITVVGCVRYTKEKYHAKSYLMLKDIFPQNAVDLGMMSKTGVKSLLYRYFRKKEKQLYSVSDHIGCMSPANMEYIIKSNPDVNLSKVGLCPNAIDIREIKVRELERVQIRKQYKLPIDKRVFVYGGNLGRPQGVDFIIQCLQKLNKSNEKEVFILIVGSGTEYGKLEKYVFDERPKSVRLMKSIPKDDFDILLAVCDIGLIFLDHRFTIPNFPSRLLNYMQVGLPVLACTDTTTDLGKIIVDNKFGWWCESNDTDGFLECIRNIEGLDEKTIMALGRNAKKYLSTSYSVSDVYHNILDS